MSGEQYGRLALYLVMAFGITWVCWWPLAFLIPAGAGAFTNATFSSLYLVGGLGPTLAALPAVALTPREGSLTAYGTSLTRWRVPTEWYVVALLLPAVLAFTLVMGAYSAEVYRSGVEGVPRGQFEAAAALGLPFLITLRRVILPQAIRAVIPPMTGNCVSMFKDTSLASTVALPELLNEATDTQALYANPSPLILAAIIYIAFLWPMVRLVSVLERRMARGRAH